MDVKFDDSFYLVTEKEEALNIELLVKITLFLGS